MIGIGENKVKIDLEGMGKLIITEKKMTPNELEESRKRTQERRELISKVEENGEWWNLWERKEAEEYFSRMGCQETVKIVIEELKKVFNDDFSEKHVKTLMEKWSSPMWDWECKLCVYNSACSNKNEMRI